MKISPSNTNADILRVAVVGTSGVGKSSVLNAFSDTNEFNENDCIESVTREAQFKRLYWMKDKSRPVELCDTQGMSDTEKQDDEHIKQMVATLRTRPYLTTLILVIDGQSPRFSGYTQNAIRLFTEIFRHSKDNILNHTVLVFTKWFRKTDENKQKMKIEYQKKFEKEYGVSNIPCYFIDSHYKVKFDEDEGKYVPASAVLQDRTLNEIAALYRYISNVRPFYLNEIQTTVTQETKLRQEMEKQQEEANKKIKEQEEAARQKLKQQEEAHQRQISQQQEAARQREIQLKRQMEDYQRKVAEEKKAMEQRAAVVHTMVFDYWNCGHFAPASRVLDLGGEKKVLRIDLTVDQQPKGHTVHDVIGDGRVIKRFSGVTDRWSSLLVEVGGLRLRNITIHTAQSPSWVAWMKIIVYYND